MKQQQEVFGLLYYMGTKPRAPFLMFFFNLFSYYFNTVALFAAISIFEYVYFPDDFFPGAMWASIHVHDKHRSDMLLKAFGGSALQSVCHPECGDKRGEVVQCEMWSRRSVSAPRIPL